MKISLLKSMTNARYRRSNKDLLQSWLCNCGWERNIEFDRDHMWCRPDEKEKSRELAFYDWTFDEAVKMNAEYLAGDLLRQKGWASPHKVGAAVLSRDICLPPDTWENCPNGYRKIRGLGGKWTSLRKALKVESIDLVDNVPTVLEKI